MGDWPGPWDGGVYEAVGLAASTLPVDVVAGATPNTEAASWTEIVSATAAECDGFWLSVIDDQGDATIANMLLDIGIGASTAEVELIGDFIFNHQNNKPSMAFVYIPIPLPAGTRIAARLRCSVASYSVRVSLLLQRQGWTRMVPSCTRCVTYGADTTDSGGQQVDPGGTANTEGAWQVMTTSCTDQVKYIVIGIGNGSDSARGANHWRVDLGVGGAGSEVACISDIAMVSSVSADVMLPSCFGPFPVNIPAGTRISLRAQCTTNNATQRVFDAALYCFG